MKRIRIGIVGAGFAARFHAHCYRRVAGFDVELHAVAAGHPDRARQFAAEHRVARAYDRVEDLLLDPEVDLARDVVAVIFAGYQSAAEGRRVEVEFC